MRVGRRLAIKLLNASKFVLAGLPPEARSSSGQATAAVDRGLLVMVARLAAESTDDLEDYNYTRVLERTESLFWFFCDNYLELVKARRYGDQGREGAGSATVALTSALSVLLRLFAPFLPFVTEEVWSWWQEGSIHRAAWPRPEELLDRAGGHTDADVRALEVSAAVLGAIRKKKSEEQRPLKTPVARAIVRAPDADRALLKAAESDLRAAGLIASLELEPGDSLDVVVELAPSETTLHRS
jgi:valyl-tRNA synthetase